MNIFKQINPEQNQWVRAVAYVIALGGLCHLSVLLLTAIIQKKSQLFNPFFAIDLDKVFPDMEHNVAMLITGWMLFGISITLMHKGIKRPPNSNGE